MKCKYNSVDEETIVAQTLNWFLFIAQVAIWAGNSRLVFGFTLEPINRKKTPTLRNQQSSKPESVSSWHISCQHKINFKECFQKRKSITPFG